jgi:hypothetical protein
LSTFTGTRCRWPVIEPDFDRRLGEAPAHVCPRRASELAEAVGFLQAGSCRLNFEDRLDLGQAIF